MYIAFEMRYTHISSNEHSARFSLGAEVGAVVRDLCRKDGTLLSPCAKSISLI